MLKEVLSTYEKRKKEKELSFDGKFKLMKVYVQDPPYTVYFARESEDGSEAVLIMPDRQNAKNAVTLKALHKIWAVSFCACSRPGSDEPSSPFLYEWKTHTGNTRNGLNYIYTRQPYGSPLNEWLENRLPLDSKTAVILTAQLLHALDAMHHPEYLDCRNFDSFVEIKQYSLIHRRVSPDNIHIIDGDFLTLLLSGFEHAVATGSSKIQGEFGGVFPFASRQQLLYPLSPEPAWDVWGAAACLYYMLTGKCPRDFTWANYHASLLKNKPVPILERRQDIPEKLAELIDSALDDSDEKLKYRSAEQFLRALLDVSEND